MTISTPVNQAADYNELRDIYRPDRIRVLLIGESPPDPAGGSRRFFYAPELTRYDNLYRGVCEAVYGRASVDAKPETLNRLKDDGYWLIDAIQEPVNLHKRAARRAQLRNGAQALAETCLKLKPELGVIVCHGLVYESVSHVLRSARVTLLHSEMLPFPLGNYRKRFVTGMRSALRDLPPR